MIAAEGFDFPGIVQGQGMSGEFATGCEVQALHGFFHAGDGSGDDAEFVDTESEKQGGELNLRGHLAAHADPDAVVVGGLGGHGEQT